MKSLLLVMAVMVVLAGCASIPVPEDENTAMVIGRMSLDFPEGFFRQSPRMLRYGVKVHFYNVTQQKTFSTITSDGYYYFLSNGTDAYVLISYEYRDQSGAGSTHLGGEQILREFKAQPGRIIYLGDITYTYNSPNVIKSEASGTRQTWDYTVTRDDLSNLEGLRKYLSDKDSSGAWLEREIVEVKAGK
jgi:hypothetical protein